MRLQLTTTQCQRWRSRQKVPSLLSFAHHVSILSPYQSMVSAAECSSPTRSPLSTKPQQEVYGRFVHAGCCPQVFHIVAISLLSSQNICGRPIRDVSSHLNPDRLRVHTNAFTADAFHSLRASENPYVHIHVPFRYALDTSLPITQTPSSCFYPSNPLSFTMSCAVGNMFIAITGGLLDRSKRRKSLYIARPMAIMPNRVASDSTPSLDPLGRQ